MSNDFWWLTGLKIWLECLRTKVEPVRLLQYVVLRLENAVNDGNKHGLLKLVR